jgi:threonine/homoserine/homoserine lactone efflux protein
MNLELYAAFVAAALALMLIPGPNVALIAANSVAYGPRYGLITVAGTSTAMVVQLAVTALGMGSLMAVLGAWFSWLRWIGVAYLVWLAVKAWGAPSVDLTAVGPERRSGKAIFLRGFLVSLTNPKTLFFYGAFFPQFVAPHAPAAPQLALLSTTFLALGVVCDGTWALLAGRFRRVLAMKARLRNRIAAFVYLAAGLGLAAARRST